MLHRARSHAALAAAALVVLASCHDGADRGADVAATSLAPAPGATGVSRRAEVRAVVDRGIDPATLDGVRLATAAGEPVATTVVYEASSRLLTIVPQAPLAKVTTYRVQLATSLRTASGERFARPIEWEFTTDAAAVWERGAAVAPGRLLASKASRRGGLLAVWAGDDDALSFARFDGAAWSPPVALGVVGGLPDVADDATGRVAVAFSTATGAAQVLVAEPGQPFGPAEPVAPLGVWVHVDVASSGHVVVSWNDTVATTGMRARVPGVGWAAPFLAALPSSGHVRVEPTGEGVVVCSFAGASAVGCRRFGVDALGNWTQLDPVPLPTTFSLLAGGDVAFRGARVLATQPVVPPPTLVSALSVHEWTPATGWQVLPETLPMPAAGSDAALGPAGELLLASVRPGEQPVARLRAAAGFDQLALGAADQPAPAAPVLGAVIAADGAAHVVWTAAVDASPGAAVRLLASSRPAGGEWREPVVIDGPFPAAEAVTDLRVVDSGDAAFAAWTRGGTVRSSALR